MRIEFEDVAWAKVKKHAEIAGYGTPESFVRDTVMRQIDASSPEASCPEEDQRVLDQLQGLGYLDCGRDI